MAQTNDALTILERRIGDDADMRQLIAEETLKAQIARMIYEARTDARRPDTAGPGRARRHDTLGDRPVGRG
jgi:hypothetical protein